MGNNKGSYLDKAKKRCWKKRCGLYPWRASWTGPVCAQIVLIRHSTNTLKYLPGYPSISLMDLWHTCLGKQKQNKRTEKSLIFSLTTPWFSHFSWIWTFMEQRGKDCFGPCDLAWSFLSLWFSILSSKSGDRTSSQGHHRIKWHNVDKSALNIPEYWFTVAFVEIKIPKCFVL